MMKRISRRPPEGHLGDDRPFRRRIRLSAVGCRLSAVGVSVFGVSAFRQHLIPDRFPRLIRG